MSLRTLVNDFDSDEDNAPVASTTLAGAAAVPPPPKDVYPKLVLQKIVCDKHWGTKVSGLPAAELKKISLRTENFPPQAFSLVVDGISRAPMKLGGYYIAMEDMESTSKDLFDSHFSEWYNEDDAQKQKQNIRSIFCRWLSTMYVPTALVFEATLEEAGFTKQKANDRVKFLRGRHLEHEIKALTNRVQVLEESLRRKNELLEEEKKKNRAPDCLMGEELMIESDSKQVSYLREMLGEEKEKNFKLATRLRDVENVDYIDALEHDCEDLREKNKQLQEDLAFVKEAASEFENKLAIAERALNEEQHKSSNLAESLDEEKKKNHELKKRLQMYDSIRQQMLNIKITQDATTECMGDDDGGDHFASPA